MSKKRPAADAKREEATSKLTNKSQDKPKGPEHFDYGLSVSLDNAGHILSPEGYMMAEEMFQYIYEKLDVELMLLRVGNTYRSHGVNSSISMILNAMDI